jgi:hypothetical protein
VENALKSNNLESFHVSMEHEKTLTRLDRLRDWSAGDFDGAAPSLTLRARPAVDLFPAIA